MRLSFCLMALLSLPVFASFKLVVNSEHYQLETILNPTRENHHVGEAEKVVKPGEDSCVGRYELSLNPTMIKVTFESPNENRCTLDSFSADLSEINVKELLEGKNTQVIFSSGRFNSQKRNATMRLEQ